MSRETDWRDDKTEPQAIAYTAACRKSGQITIFLSLMLMVLVSFLCTALRSAQTAGSRYLFTLTSEAVVRSMFGAYDTRMWEQYRILVLTDLDLAQEIAEECSASYQQNGTLFPLEIASVELEEPVTLADNGAAGWEEAAISYMEVRLPVDVVAQLLEQTKLMEGLEDVTHWLTGFRDLLKPLMDLEKKLCALEDKLAQAVEAFEEGKRLLTELRTACEAVSQILESADAETAINEEALLNAWIALEDSYQQIQEYLSDRGWFLEEMAEEANENLEAAELLGGQIQELLNRLSGSDDLGLASLADLGGYLSGLTQRSDFLQDLPEQLDRQKDFLQQIAQMTLPDKEEILVGAGDAALAVLQELAAGLSGETWSPEHPETTEGTEEDSVRANILIKLKEWLDLGILSLVLEDASQVSEASLGRTLPRTERDDSAGILDEAYRSLLYGEYALRYTAEYGQGGAAGLQYETEYLIAGMESDRANLAAVASRLLLTRGTLNFLYLLQNMSDNESVRLVAAGISAALGGWIPEGLISVLLMVVWAMAEAVCDVRALLAGKQVPFWKDSSSWQLALEHLWTLLEDGFVMGLDRSDGMSYEEYLRLLLFLVPTEEKCFRTMELAEENLRADRQDFRIDQALYRAVVVLKGKAAGQAAEMRLEYGYE